MTKTALSRTFARVAAPIMIAFALTASPALAQGGPGYYGGEVQIDIPYDEYAPLTRQISDSHIALINNKSTPVQIDIAIQTLIGMTQHRSQNLRSEALYALKNVAQNNFPADRRDPANDALILLAKTGRIETRTFLAENLADFIENPRYAEYVLAFQADKDENVRYYFMQSQKRLADRNENQDAAVLGFVLDAADDPSARVREAAGETMTVLARRTSGAYLPQALTFLEAQTKDTSDTVRNSARLNFLRIAETHVSVAPRALELARVTFADTTAYGTIWQQKWPVDYVINIAKKHTGHRADVFTLLEETANGTNAVYNLYAATQLVKNTVENPAEHPIALRVLPLLIQSTDSSALSAAGAAARDIALNNPALADASLALLAQAAAKERGNISHLATLAEKNVVPLPAVMGHIEQLVTSTDELVRSSSLSAIARLANLPGADNARLYSAATAAFAIATPRSVEEAQNALVQLTLRNPALSAQTTDMFARRLTDTEARVRGQSAFGLGQLAASPSTADPRQLALILPLADDSNSSTRTDVAKALIKVAENPALINIAFNRLSLMALDTDYSVRTKVLEALQKTTDPALLTHPAYIRALTILRNDSNSSIGNSAKAIYSTRVFDDLNRLAPIRNRLETDLPATLSNPGAATAFVAEAKMLLGSIDPVTRMKGTDMLGQIGFAHAAQAPAVIAALAPLAHDYEADIRFTVVRHIGMIGMKSSAHAEPALHALAPLAADPDGRVSGMAVMAIGRMGASNPALKDDAQAILRPLEQTSTGPTQGAIRQQLRMLGP